MGKLIFGSTGERHCFHHLEKVWGKKWKLYPNQPFRQFCRTTDLVDLISWSPHGIKLTKEEISALNTTSVDFVLCSPRGEVVIGIELDGMGLGYSCGPYYRQQRRVSEHRRRITELKLKVAFGSNTPFLVVGPEEFLPLGPKCNLSVVDGVIGRILSSQAWRDKLSLRFGPEMAGVDSDGFAGMSSTQQAFIIDDYAMEVEVIAELANDPISQQIMELESKRNFKGWRLSFPSPPQIEAAETDPEYAECQVSIERADGSSVSSTSRIRSFNSPFFLMAGLLERVAKLQALLKI